MFWIKFKDVEFEDICSTHKKVLADPFWKYSEGFVPKTLQQLGLNTKAVFSNRNDR